MRKLILFFIGIITLTHCIEVPNEGVVNGSFPILDVPVKTLQIPKEAKSEVINIKTNRDYDVTITGADGWITCTKSPSSFTLNFTENTLETPRSATIKVTTANSSCTNEFTVTQAESGIKTYQGNFVAQNNEALNAIATEGYTRINGALLLGAATLKTSPGSISPSSDIIWTADLGNNVLYTFTTNSSLTNISPLSPKITEVMGAIHIIGNLELENLTPLATINTIGVVFANNPKITSISSLLNAPSLHTFTIRNSPQVTDFNLLGTKPSIQYLDISNNALSDISFVSTLTNLRAITLGKGVGETNTIHDITPLYSLSNLQYLWLSGLPIPKAQLAEIQKRLPTCYINTDNMKAYAPVITKPTGSNLAKTSFTANSSVTDQGFSPLIEKGFLFGRDLKNLTKHIIPGTSLGNYTLSLTSLTESTKYYLVAYAKNSNDISYSDTVNIYTEGLPVMGSLKISNIGNNSVNVADTIRVLGHSTVSEYGFILGSSSSVTLSDAEIKKDYSETNIVPTPFNCDVTGLKPGHTYFVRSYAINIYGTTYGNAIRFETTGSPDIPMYIFNLDVTVPNYLSGEAPSALSNLYGYFFREDNIVGIGDALAPSIVQGNIYTYYLYKGEQDLIFTNVGQNSNNLNIKTLISPSEYMRITCSSKNGLNTDVLSSTFKDKEIDYHSAETVTLTRHNANISIYIKSKNDGVEVADLSTMFSELSLSLNNFYSYLSFSSGVLSTYGGEGAISFSSANISKTNTQTMAEEISVFPTISSKKLSMTITAKLKDNSTVVLQRMDSPIEKDKKYNIYLTISKNPLNSSFTLESMIVIEDEIEF